MAKWERGVHRLDVFRSAGLGEARIALRIRQLMMQNTNLGVAKDMAIHASKIMDLVNPALDLADGFEIRVKRAEAAGEANAHGTRPGDAAGSGRQEGKGDGVRWMTCYAGIAAWVLSCIAMLWLDGPMR